MSKSFYEYFLDEVKRQLDAGEIDQITAERWIETIRAKLQQLPDWHPMAMPKGN